MSILIINCKSKEIANYDEWLQDCKEDLLLLNDRQTVDEYDHENYLYVESFTNYDHNMNVYIRALQLYEAYQYHTVVAIDEFDIYPASLLRERLQLQGQKPHSARQFRDKTLMKKIAHQHGLQVPPFRALHSIFDLIDFIAEVGYPVIIKPIDGASAVDTTIIEKQSDLEMYIKQGIPVNMEVEKFIEGDFHHVDGIIIDGQLEFICVSRMLHKGCISYQDGNGIGAYLLSPDNPVGQRIKDYTQRLLEVLDPPNNTTFHAEIFHTVDDEIVLCEIASRTGGVRINREIELGYGVNLNQLFIRKQCGLPLTWPEDRMLKKQTGYILIPPKAGIVASVPTEDPPAWVEEFRLLIKPGQVCSEPADAIDEIASFVVSGDSEEQVVSRLQQAVDWFMERVTWE